MDFLLQPLPWYAAGPLIGLMVPALLFFGNKNLGISSSLRHFCAACVPGNIEFFKYNWRAEMWNLFFVVGIFIGALLAHTFLVGDPNIVINEATKQDLAQLGLNDFSGMIPEQIFSLQNLFTLQGFVFIVLGGLFVGFGTRYAGGCTSGHAIMGLSNLQWPSLVAVVGFFLGGLFMTHIVFPFLF